MKTGSVAADDYVIDVARMPQAAQVWVREIRSTPENDQARYMQIFERLNAVVFGRGRFPWCEGDKKLPLKQRRAFLREVDDLHRSGTAWPHLRMGRWDAQLGDYAYVPFLPRVDRSEARRPSKRPDHLPYCVFWTGAYWAPADSAKCRREAGYAPLMMCWPPPLPSAGQYICSGPRARFAYRIAEVERFSPPRTVKRYTCRLWCVRVDPKHVPKGVDILPFYWHPRKRASRRASVDGAL